MPKKTLFFVVFLLILIAGVLGIYLLRDRINKKLNWQTYRNTKQGYEIKLPRGWTSENVPGAAEVFWSPDKKAFVAVQFIVDPRLLDEGGEEKMLKEIKESFRKDQDYELISFDSRFEKGSDVPATASGYLARGLFNYQKEKYIFQEYAVQVADQEMLAVIRGAMQEGAVKNYEETVEEIMGSFNPVAGMREAFSLVEKQKEVIEFEKELAKAGKKAKYGIEDGGDVWLVQVYEIVEQNDEGHTATFNWYRVNKETKEISKEFETNGEP